MQNGMKCHRQVNIAIVRVRVCQYIRFHIHICNTYEPIDLTDWISFLHSLLSPFSYATLDSFFKI